MIWELLLGTLHKLSSSILQLISCIKIQNLHDKSLTTLYENSYIRISVKDS